MAELIAGFRPTVRAAQARAQSTAIDLDPQTERLVVRIERPTAARPGLWSASQRIRARVVVEVDGEQLAASFEVVGGIRQRRAGGDALVESTESVFTWHLPEGFFDDERKADPAQWDQIRYRRLGETAKSTYRAWVEIEHVEGAGTVAPTCHLEGVAIPAPDHKFHHSIAYDTATSAFEDDGDGVISVSFTAAAGSNRAAVVFAASDRSGAVTAHTVTYGGAAASISRPLNTSDGSFSRITGDVFKDSEIGSGAKTVQLTCAEDPDGGSGIAVASFSGVDQTTPAGTAQTSSATSGSTASVTVTGLDSTKVVIDGLYVFDPAVTIGADQTERTSAATAQQGLWVSTQPGGSGGVMSWSDLANEHSYGAFALNEAAAGSPSATGTPSLPFFNTAGVGVQTQAATAAAALPFLSAAGSAVMLPSAIGTPSLPFLSASGSASSGGDAATISGTAVASMTESEAVAGGETIVVTLSGAVTWED